jgi:hypothetical protein
MEVLALLPDSVLLVHEGELVFLRAGAAPDPVFRMTWASPWLLERARTVKSAKPAPARKTKKDRRR